MAPEFADWLESDEEEWKRPPGIFVLVDVRGDAGTWVRDVQQRADPRLAAAAVPHLTLVGSSGLGPIAADVPADDLRARLAPVVEATAPFTVHFGAPTRFLQTNIIVLPLEPHGPLRQLHEAIGRCGLRFDRTRHRFTPHVTLSLYRTLSRAAERELLQLRADAPLVVDHIRLSLTDEPNRPRELFELRLGVPDARQSGGAPAA